MSTIPHAGKDCHALRLASPPQPGCGAIAGAGPGQSPCEAGDLAARNPPAPVPAGAPGCGIAAAADGIHGRAPAAASQMPAPAVSNMAPPINLAEGKSDADAPALPGVAACRSAMPAVADVILLNPSEVYMLGKSVGSTNLILWNKANDATIVDIEVGIDTARAAVAARRTAADEKDIKVTTAADTLILSGTVSDVVEGRPGDGAGHRLRAAQRPPRPGQRRAGRRPARRPEAMPARRRRRSTSSPPRVVNMLSIAAPQQVMLEVKVAEVSKTLVDQLGASIGASQHQRQLDLHPAVQPADRQPGVLDAFNGRNGNFATLDAQKRDGLVKMLAEPTVMAISGQEASFLAGGKIFIPVSQTNTGGIPDHHAGRKGIRRGGEVHARPCWTAGAST